MHTEIDATVFDLLRQRANDATEVGAAAFVRLLTLAEDRNSGQIA